MPHMGSPFTGRTVLPQVHRHGYHPHMNASKESLWTETLPDPLPDNPLKIAAQWLAQARIDAAQPNPDSMVLATVDGSGQPSARVVLCKEIAPHQGFIVFYTNYHSRKGRELQINPRAAVVFHWDHRHRQVRAEGNVRGALRCRERRLFPHPPLAKPHRCLGEPAERARAIAQPFSAQRWPQRRTVSVFRTTAPAPRSRSISTSRCPGRRIGADFA